MGDTDKYRARASLVDAFQWAAGCRGDSHDLHALGEWAARVDYGGRLRRGEETPSEVTHPIEAVALGHGRFRVEIATAEGRVKVRLGDFIVHTPDGHFCPCDPDLFEALFERADDDASEAAP